VSLLQFPSASRRIPFAAMDTYAPRTIEQFHACTRQRLKSAAAQQKQLQQGKGAAAAAAGSAAAAAPQKAKAAAATAAPVERADGRKNTQLRSTCEWQDTHSERVRYASSGCTASGITASLSLCPVSDMRVRRWLCCASRFLLFCRRLLVLQSGVVSAAVGSAYVERQGTKVLCAMSVSSCFFPARMRSSTAARFFLRDCC
jgi:hypothetical protein